MELREYKSNDCDMLAQLFYNTVHKVNSKHYSKEQLDVWATGNVDISPWDISFSEHNTIIAEKDGEIVGFGDMDDNGYLDRLYIHNDHQRQGIATVIVNRLEQQAILHGISHFTTHASITAIPFFENRGYHAIRENKVVRSGIVLTNFVMEKDLVR